MSFDDTVIVTVKRHNYKINFWVTTKSKAMDRMRNDDLRERCGL